MRTMQRSSIMAYLKGNTSHPSALDIHQAISKNEGMISVATVYNTLAMMKKKGLVREVAVTSGGQKRYDPNVSPHAHLICSDCGKIVDVNLPFAVEVPEVQRQGFEILESDVHFYGLCSSCKTKDRNASVQRQQKKTGTDNR